MNKDRTGCTENKETCKKKKRGSKQKIREKNFSGGDRGRKTPVGRSKLSTRRGKGV